MLAKLPVRALHQLGIKFACRGLTQLAPPLRPIVRDGSAAAPFPPIPHRGGLASLSLDFTASIRNRPGRFSTADVGHATGLEGSDHEISPDRNAMPPDAAGLLQWLGRHRQPAAGR